LFVYQSVSVQAWSCLCVRFVELIWYPILIQVLISRNYRGDIPMNAIDSFPKLLLEQEDVSVFQINHRDALKLSMLCWLMVIG